MLLEVHKPAHFFKRHHLAAPRLQTCRFWLCTVDAVIRLPNRRAFEFLPKLRESSVPEARLRASPHGARVHKQQCNTRSSKMKVTVGWCDAQSSVDPR